MSKKALKTGILATTLCGALVATATPADAALILRLCEGTSCSGSPTIVTVTDGDSDGVVSFFSVPSSGPFANFGVNASTGVSKPVFPNAELDLLSLNILTSDSGGSLTIELTDTDYTFGVDGGPGSLNWLWGGTATGDSFVTGQGWKNVNNTEFGLGPLQTGLLGPFSGLAGSEGSAPHGGLTDPYSMTIRIIYTAFAAGDSYSGNFNLQNTVVPEPAGVALFGLGLTAVAMAFRRRRRTE